MAMSTQDTPPKRFRHGFVAAADHSHGENKVFIDKKMDR
jgi:hypothetical protein